MSGQSWVLAAALTLGLLPGCGSGHDAGSRQLVAITHLSTEPAGTVSVIDDSSYTFLLANAKMQTQGTLSAGEFATLKSHVADLEPLYSQSVPDSGVCEQAIDSYLLISKVGSACFVVSSVSEPDPRATLEYFVALYKQLAVTR